MAPLASVLLPSAGEWSYGGRPYKFSHCLAVYHQPAAEGGLSLPGILLAEALTRRNRRRCSLMRGLPAAPPIGSLVVATRKQAECADRKSVV
jgi:hypothetical protein